MTITASETYTPTSGTTKIYVECVGGGGGGGGASSTGGSAGGGGGGAGYATKFISSPAASYSVTIGSAGSGGAAGPNDGTAGTATTFGSPAVLTCNGGGLGKGNTNAMDNVVGGAGGAGGTASGGDVNINGQRGAAGLISHHTSLQWGGTGGSSTLGLGGQLQETTNAGNAGTGNGAGGSGGNNLSTTAEAGGAGTAGVCVVWEF